MSHKKVTAGIHNAQCQSVCNNAPDATGTADNRKYRLLSLAEYEVVEIGNVTEISEELSASVFRVSVAQEKCFRGYNKETVRLVYGKDMFQEC